MQVVKTTMKIVTLILLMSSSLVGAADLCADWEKRIEPDMRIAEADFTKEAALEAHRAVGELIEGKSFEWYEPLNLQKFIYGYLLKQKALKATESR